MAAGHDSHDVHALDDHGHGHDDHGHHDHAQPSSFFVVPPIVLGVIVAIVLIVLLGTESGAAPWSSPF